MSGNSGLRNRSRVGLEAIVGPFHVEFAVGTEPRLAEYRLRYRAFVEEHHWESASACPNGLERDRFDPFSCAALVTDADSGEAAACQRLILPERLPSGLLTNVERECRPLQSAAAFAIAGLPRCAWAEVSRLTIAPRFRAGSSRASAPAMTTITYASMALAIALDRSVLCSLSDPRTARLSRRLGVHMIQIGEAVEFHGHRAAFRIDVADVLHGVAPEWRPTVDRLVAMARFATAGLRHDPGTSSHAA